MFEPRTCTHTRFPVFRALYLCIAAKDNGLTVWSACDWAKASGNTPSFTLSILDSFIFLFLSSPVLPLCSLILLSKLGIYVGASAKEQGGITTSVFGWLWIILSKKGVSLCVGALVEASWRQIQFFFAFSDAVQASRSGLKTPIAVIYLSSVKDFHQKRCLHFNSPLAADWLPAAFNGTGKLNEVKGIDDGHAWETKEEGNLRNA